MLNLKFLTIVVTYFIMLVSTGNAFASVLNVKIKRKYRQLSKFPLSAEEIKTSAISSSLVILLKKGPFKLKRYKEIEDGILQFDFSFNPKVKHAFLKLSFLSPNYKKQSSLVKFSTKDLTQDKIYNKLEKMGSKLSYKFLNNFDYIDNINQDMGQENHFAEKRRKNINIISNAEKEKIDSERRLVNIQKKQEMLLKQEKIINLVNNIEDRIINNFAQTGIFLKVKDLNSKDNKYTISNLNFDDKTRDYTYNLNNILQEKIMICAKVNGNIMDQESTIIDFNKNILK